MELSSFILGLTGILGSLSVATVTILSYKRNRKLENENVIFKLKVEGYTVIMEQLISIVQKINKVRLLIDDEGNINFEKYDVDAINIYAQDIDDKADTLLLIASKYSMVFPEYILAEIERASIFLFEEDIKTKSEPALTLYGFKITEHYDQLLEIADSVQQFMRRDLHTEKLNQSLFKRLK